MHNPYCFGFVFLGWLFKNKDPINEAMVGLMLAGSNPLVVYLFTEKDTGGKKKGGSMATISAGHRVRETGSGRGKGVVVVANGGLVMHLVCVSMKNSDDVWMKCGIG